MNVCVVVGRLPNSPENFELVDTGLSSATFSWSSEPHIDDSQLEYRIHYNSLSSEGAYIEVRIE